MSLLRLFLVSIFVTVGGLALESGLVAIGLSLAFVPDIVLIFVAFLSFYQCTPYGAFLVFLCGLLVDIASGQLLGPWAGSYVLCFGALAVLSDRVFIESGFSLMSIAGMLVLVSHLLFLLISFDPLIQLISQWDMLLGRAVTTALIAPLLFPMLFRVLSLSRLDAIKGRRMSTY